MAKWSKKIIIEQIQTLVCSKQSVVRKERCALFGASVRYFGSWKNAVESAGIRHDVTKSYKSWDKAKILHNISLLNNMTDSHVNKNNKSLYLAAIRYFGSWSNAIEEIGLSYSDIIKYNKWTKDKVLDCIRNLENMTDSYAGVNHKPLYMAAIKRFGSWPNAVKSAGFDYSQIKHSYSKEDILFEILSSIFDDVRRHETFEWLVFKRKMHVDFYLPKINLAIERQGEQHYYPVCFGGMSKESAMNNFNITKKRDEHKCKLLKKHGVKLLTVPYYEKLTKENIERKIKNVCSF